MSTNKINYFAQLSFRGRREVFGIKAEDRRQHMYVIGQTGTGKTTLLETMIRQDIDHGEGVAVIDPHGDFLEHIVRHIPESRKQDILYLNVADPDCPFGFNPFTSIPADRRALAADGILDAFRKIWATTWGPRLEHFLRNALLTLIEQERATLADITRLFDEEEFRRRSVARVTNKQVRKFWHTEFPGYAERFKAEAIAPIRNKVGHFLSDETIFRVMVEGRKSINLRDVMDQGKILLVNISKGRIGPDNSALLGALLVAQIDLAALTRADMPEEERRDFYLYLDEFQNFTTMSTAGMLAELRKYRLNLILAHQYISQLDEEVRDAILGNVGTIIAFRIGPLDAPLLARQFEPDAEMQDLKSLGNYHFWIKLMVGGAAPKAFSAQTIPPRE